VKALAIIAAQLPFSLLGLEFDNDGLFMNDHVSQAAKKHLKIRRRELDPVRLLHGIRELQETLSALAKGPGLEKRPAPASKGLEEFLASLPHLWQDGEVRPTHRTQSMAPRWRRIRVDPFEKARPKALGWLQNEPDATAKELFERLQKQHPNTFNFNQLRTMQRRVRGWRQAIARELVYAGVATGRRPLTNEVLAFPKVAALVVFLFVNTTDFNTR